MGSKICFEGMDAAMKAVRSGSPMAMVCGVKALETLMDDADAPRVLAREDTMVAILRVFQFPLFGLTSMHTCMLGLLQQHSNPNGIKQLVAAISHQDPKVAFAATYFTGFALKSDRLRERMVAAGALSKLVQMIRHPVVHCRGVAIAWCILGNDAKPACVWGDKKVNAVVQSCAQQTPLGAALMAPGLDLVQNLMHVLSDGGPWVREGEASHPACVFEQFRLKMPRKLGVMHEMSMSQDRVLACNALVMAAEYDHRGVARQVWRMPNAVNVLAGAVMHAEPCFKDIALLLMTTLLFGGEHGPATFLDSHWTRGDLSRRLVEARGGPHRGVLGMMPNLIKTSQPVLAEEAMTVLSWMYCTSWDEPSGPAHGRAFPEAVMAPIVRALVDYLEAGAHACYEAAHCLGTMSVANDPALTWPLSQNPALLVRELSKIVATEVPKFAVPAGHLVCRHLDPVIVEAHSPAPSRTNCVDAPRFEATPFRSAVVEAAVSGGFVPGAVRLLRKRRAESEQGWHCLQHGLLMGLFQVLAYSADDGLINEAVAGGLLPSCGDLLRTRSLPPAMQPAALVAARKLAYFPAAPTELRELVVQPLLKGLASTLRGHNPAALRDAADLVMMACPADRTCCRDGEGGPVGCAAGRVPTPGRGQPHQAQARAGSTVPQATLSCCSNGTGGGECARYLKGCNR